MSKIKLLLDVINDMRSLADSLETMANAIEGKDSESEPELEITADTPVVQEKVKTDSEPTYTLEQVRSILSKKSAEGHGSEIRELLGKYGQSRLSDIDPKDYPALLKDAEVL